MTSGRKKWRKGVANLRVRKNHKRIWCTKLLIQKQKAQIWVHDWVFILNATFKFFAMFVFGFPIRPQHIIIVSIHQPDPMFLRLYFGYISIKLFWTWSVHLFFFFLVLNFNTATSIRSPYVVQHMRVSCS